MKKELSLHAACAKEIRKELKSKFSTTKFSVTSDSYSGGNSVRVRWEDGQTYKSVENIVGKFEFVELVPEFGNCPRYRCNQCGSVFTTLQPDVTPDRDIECDDQITKQGPITNERRVF